MPSARLPPALPSLLLALLVGCGTDAVLSSKAPSADSSAAPTGGSGSAARSSSPQPTAASAEAPAPLLMPTSAAGTPAASQMCAGAQLRVQRVIPTVWLMIDGSGSMGAPLDLTGPSRFSLLRDALLAAASGLVPRLQGSIAFGLYVYDGGLSLPGVPGPQCPRVVVSEPQLNSAAALSSAYPELEIGASTPTHYALLDLQMRIAAAGSSKASPTYIVLATDGKPNLCDFHDGLPATPDTEQEAVDTVQQLAAAGTQTFVVSLAGDDPDLQAHLEAVAQAGNTGKPPFTPRSQSELAAALMQILGSAASCEVQLQGRVEAGRECSGSVLLDGKPLTCGDPDGYRLKADHTSLELLGSACASLQTAVAPSLEASFPCGDVTLL